MLATHDEAEKVIMTHVIWSLGAGLMPIPMLDIAAVTAVQIDMLRQLAAIYKVDVSQSAGKAFVTALTGGTFARIGASLLKAVPGLGSVVGGISMSVMSGASTYAVGQVAKNHFTSGLDLSAIDLGTAKAAYAAEYERGEKVAEEHKASAENSKVAFEAVEKLRELKERGLVTEAEFEAMKQQLLARL